MKKIWNLTCKFFLILSLRACLCPPVPNKEVLQCVNVCVLAAEDNDKHGWLSLDDCEMLCECSSAQWDLPLPLQSLLPPFLLIFSSSRFHKCTCFQFSWTQFWNIHKHTRTLKDFKRNNRLISNTVQANEWKKSIYSFTPGLGFTVAQSVFQSQHTDNTHSIMLLKTRGLLSDHILLQTNHRLVQETATTNQDWNRPQREAPF